MITQPSTTHYKFGALVELETAAKLHQIIKGMSQPAHSIGGRNIRKQMRPMTTSRYIADLIEEAVKDVKLDAESIKWLQYQKGRLVMQREKADAKVAAGINRKPKDEWLKPGRVAGKSYANYPKKRKAV